MPGQAAHGRHCLELVNDVARDEVDVVMAQADASVTDAFAAQLVQFGIVHPLYTLQEETQRGRKKDVDWYGHRGANKYK